MKARCVCLSAIVYFSVVVACATGMHQGVSEEAHMIGYGFFMEVESEPLTDDQDMSEVVIERVLISTIFCGGSAQLAGVFIGDEVISIDEHVLHGMTFVDFSRVTQPDKKRKACACKYGLDMNQSDALKYRRVRTQRTRVAGNHPAWMRESIINAAPA